MKKLFFILSFLVFVPTARAQMDCEEVPSCAELGYTQDSCAGGKGVRCPFDENKFYCAGVKQLPDAENPGVTDENWTAECADKINYCTAYNNDCQCTACESGYLLSDGACVPECDKSVDICAAESKTFNSANCACEACPTNYQFNSETKACEQIACDTTKVEHCATYDSEYEPCTCQTCETNYLLVDGVCVLQCSGANQCLYQGSCVTCYKSCPVYWRYYLDEEPDGAVCSPITSIYKGSGNGAEATYEPCYDDCVTCEKACEIFTGLDNTTDAVAQLGNKGLAVYAATQFYVGSKNGAFGQGQWYLPAIGEWMEFYGTDISKPLLVLGFSDGAIGDNMALIKNALNILKNKGVEAEPLSGYYWSSTSLGSSNVATLNASDGRRLSKCSYYECSSSGVTSYVRCSLFLTLTTNGTAPAIGDVVYLDKTYGAASDYDGSKTPVGIIASVSGNDVKIINLKNLTFSSKNTVGNFDPNNPYSGITEQTAFLPENSSSMYLHDITGNFPDRSSDNAISVMNKYSCTCPFKPGVCTLSAAICAAENKTFNSANCTCQTCEDGFTLQDDGTCKRVCTNLPEGCLDYDDECNCTQCEDIPNCRGFNDDCSCKTCKNDFYLGQNNRKCYQTFCDNFCNVDYCKVCSEDGGCLKCADGWVLEGDKCTLPDNQCIEGAILYSDYKCYDYEKAPSNVTPIGIIYCSTTVHGCYAVALDEEKHPWSVNLKDQKVLNTKWGSGRRHTLEMIVAGAEESSAASYCYNYSKTDDDKGMWYIPDNYQVPRAAQMCLLNFSLKKVGSEFAYSKYSVSYYLMVDESNLNGYCKIYGYSSVACDSVFTNDALCTASTISLKTESRSVRCIIDYQNVINKVENSCAELPDCVAYNADCSCDLCMPPKLLYTDGKCW